MRTFRFFCPELDRERPELPADELPHIRKVLRLKPGQEVELFDGRGRSCAARLVTVERRKVVCERLARPVADPPPTLAIEVLTPLPKGRRAVWLIEKLSELGVVSWRPLQTEHSEWDPAGFPRERPALERRALEAAKQCRRNALLRIGEPISPAELDFAPGAALFGAVDPAGDGPSPALPRSADGRWTILVGPEGGLTAAEEAALQAKGARPFHLPTPVLRLETAALALTAALLALTSAGAAGRLSSESDRLGHSDPERGAPDDPVDGL